jgi:hypothetical protein
MQHNLHSPMFISVAAVPDVPEPTVIDVISVAAVPEARKF